MREPDDDDGPGLWRPSVVLWSPLLNERCPAYSAPRAATSDQGYGWATAVPVCHRCAHRHHPDGWCADHDWDDRCPYVGTLCEPAPVTP